MTTMCGVPSKPGRSTPIRCCLPFAGPCLTDSFSKFNFWILPQAAELLDTLHQQLAAQGIPQALFSYFLVEGQTTNSAYVTGEDQIQVKMKNGTVVDIVEASELPTIQALSKIVRKYYVCWAKTVSLRA